MNVRLIISDIRTKGANIIVNKVNTLASDSDSVFHQSAFATKIPPIVIHNVAISIIINIFIIIDIDKLIVLVYRLLF